MKPEIPEIKLKDTNVCPDKNCLLRKAFEQAKEDQEQNKKFMEMLQYHPEIIEGIIENYELMEKLLKEHQLGSHFSEIAKKNMFL